MIATNIITKIMLGIFIIAAFIKIGGLLSYLLCPMFKYKLTKKFYGSQSDNYKKYSNEDFN
jgi:hypothetical protein